MRIYFDLKSRMTILVRKTRIRHTKLFTTFFSRQRLLSQEKGQHIFFFIFRRSFYVLWKDRRMGEVSFLSLSISVVRGLNSVTKYQTSICELKVRTGTKRYVNLLRRLLSVESLSVMRTHSINSLEKKFQKKYHKYEKKLFS